MEFTRSFNRRARRVALLAAVVFPALSFADTVFSDGTFDPSNYTTAFTYSYASAGTVGGVVSQCTSCGNPGYALSTVVTTTEPTPPSGTTTNLDIGLLNTGFTYTPSAQGQILAIAASVDNYTNIQLEGLGSIDDTFSPLIFQDGNYYVDTLYSGPYTDPGNTTFNTLSGTLVASDFGEINTSTGAVNHSINPNFGGDTMEFGLMITGGAIFVPAFTEDIVYDNLNLDLQTAPEPATMTLTAAALAALCLLARKKLAS